MASNSVKQEDLVIPPFRGHPSRGYLASSSHQNPREDPECYSEPPRPFSSTPNPRQVVVVPREQAKTRRGTLFKTYFRVGKVGLRRSQTYMSEKEDGSLSRTEFHMQGYKPYKSTPNLQSQPFAHSAQSHGEAASLRRRETWPLPSGESKKRGYGLKHRIGASQSTNSSTGDAGSRQSGAPLIPGPNPDLEPLESIKRPLVRLEDIPPFWESYNKMADFEDREFVKALGINLDTLLIFAGLFSAVNTSFIIEALQTLQPDQSERTNDLIRSVILILHNSTFLDNALRDEMFNPTPRAFRTTAVFFVSLTFSLTAAFGAVMGKQWLSHYEREGVLKPPLERGRERQRKLEARDKWHMEGVIETLPTLLQISLFLFLIALVDFLWSINIRLAYIVMAFSLVPAIFYICTTAIAVVYPISPFQTRLSISIQHLWSKPSISTILPTAKQLVAAGKVIYKFVFEDLPDWQPPLGKICAIIPALAIIVVHLLIVVPLTWLSQSTPRLQRRISHFVPFLATLVPDPSSTSSDSSFPSSDSSSTGTDSSSTNIDSNDILDVQCLNTYIQRASLPQDLALLLASLSVLPPQVSIHVNHPAVKSLVELGVHRVVPACYSYIRGGKLASKIEIDVTCLFKILHLAYTSFNYGFNRVDGYRYLVSRDVDCWIIQELFNQLLQGSPDVESALMAVDLIPHPWANYTITWTEASLATLYQTLEKPSSELQNYLPYLSLLDCATNHGTTIAETKLPRILHLLSSSMWTDGKPDLDYHRGALRLGLLPQQLGDDADEYRFSKYLRQWREGGIRRDSPPRSLFNAEYATAFVKLLDLHPYSLFWLSQLENDGHVDVLLSMMKSRGDSLLRALYSLLELCYRRGAISPPGCLEGNPRLDRGLYLNSEGVEAILSAWDGLYWKYNRPFRIQEVMKHTVSYFEEAKRLQLLEGHDLTKLVMSYKDVGNSDMPAGDQRESLYRRVDALPRTLIQSMREAGY